MGHMGLLYYGFLEMSIGGIIKAVALYIIHLIRGGISSIPMGLYLIKAVALYIIHLARDGISSALACHPREERSGTKDLARQTSDNC